MATEQGFDRALDVLGHPYRRRLLFSFRHQNPLTIADPHSGDESLVPAVDVDTGPEVRQAPVVHSHLPKLESVGYVDWDKVTSTIRKGPEWDAIGALPSVGSPDQGRHGPHREGKRGQ